MADVRRPKYFNTGGPCRPHRDYMLDPLTRLPDARELIEGGAHFVVHAPRQSGSTTILGSLAEALTGTGSYAAARFSCETAAGTDDERHIQEILLHAMKDSAEDSGFPAACLPPDPWPEAPTGRMLFTALSAWAAKSPLPLVLLIDEVDALVGPALDGILRQLREGILSASTPFPHSLVLCGRRHVLDYRDPDESDLLDVSVAALRLGAFTFEEVAELYGQHTAATGQVFEERAVRRAFEVTQGQPWLANALARDIIEVMSVPASVPITDVLVDEAVRRLIEGRPTHLDSLAGRLDEPRVQQVIVPILSGRAPGAEHLEYVQDLALVTRTHPVQIANPIYQEVMVRRMQARFGLSVTPGERPRSGAYAGYFADVG
ncbi:hypothetical protein [Actinomadura rupiterrae]|uniref:hypothetical protein n=1 Tax=Actinomadura rupiterrae TaxID=559627 RepID=UPI0020A53170|nr:hypothetical protein [Actinomadura rupiterrae]MCP2337823.1 hypothetical protein [Actinomadura rupiterrae]